MIEYELEKTEHHTQLTLCCEVEPDLGLAFNRCPDCGQHDPKTIDRVTISRELVANE